MGVAVDYFNSIVDGFSRYDPIVRCGCSLSSDFNYMRSFRKILFQHSTLAWWAACLGVATEVRVYGPWRKSKQIQGKENKNLSLVALPGWIKWE